MYWFTEPGFFCITLHVLLGFYSRIFDLYRGSGFVAQPRAQPRLRSNRLALNLNEKDEEIITEAIFFVFLLIVSTARWAHNAIDFLLFGCSLFAFFFHSGSCSGQASLALGK